MTPAQASSGVIRMEESFAATTPPFAIRTRDCIID